MQRIKSGGEIMEVGNVESNDYTAVYAYGQHNVNYFGLGACKDEWED